MAVFQLSATPIQLDTARRLLGTDPGCGAYVAFEGWVRNHHQGRAVSALSYRAHPVLAVRAGTQLVQLTAAEPDVLGVAAIHRVGDLVIGDVAVWIGVLAGHRAAAFQHCRALLDRIKSEVPIWKHEQYTDGTSGWTGHDVKPP